MTWFDHIGSAYKQMSKLGFDPRTVDEMEVWELAEILVNEDQTSNDGEWWSGAPDLSGTALMQQFKELG